MELWVDLYSHDCGEGDSSDWPVWGQWRAVRAGRVEWQVSGFVLNRDAVPLKTAECKAPFAPDTRFSERDGQAMAEVLFPEQVFTGRLEKLAGNSDSESAIDAGGHDPRDQGTGSRIEAVSRLVSRTVDTLPALERLAIGLNVDPLLTGDNGIPRFHLATVPSERNPRLHIADRADVCIVQTRPSVAPRLAPPIPAWERVRILEITGSGTSEFATWTSKLRSIPMADVSLCPAMDAQLRVLDERPHVVICHDAGALQRLNLASTYVIAIPQPDAGTSYQQITRLLRDSSVVLVMDNMASHENAVDLLSRLCSRGTLTDALLAMHTTRPGESGVTVVGRDLQLRLRAAEAPAEVVHEARATASAWVPLGDRLRATWEGEDVRIMALSGHTVNAQAVLKPAGSGFEPGVQIRGFLPEDLRSQVEERCKAAMAGQGVFAVVDVGGDSPVGLDLDLTEATSQASEAAVQRALSGHGGDNTYLVISESSLLDAHPLPSYSPVTVNGVARASVPWQPTATRRWCRWNYRRDTRNVEPQDIPLYQPIWPCSGASPILDSVIGNALERQVDEIRNAFHKYEMAREFHPAELILMSEGHLLWPTRQPVPHATQIIEGP